MTAFNDIWYTSDDGLKLYARDYPNPDATLTVLCMHGLTRNSADFEDLAPALNARCRVISVDQRGRGLSAWDPAVANYHPGRYVQDMLTLITELNLNRLVLVGTSMGGLMAMMMSAMVPDRISAVVLNDIGPVVAEEGLNRIKSYVGKGGPVTSWDDAIEATRRVNEVAFPHYTDEDWERWVHRTYRESADGQLSLLYDPAIAEPMNEDDASAVPPDLWPLFDAMITRPLMIIRGERSDILAPDCLGEMQRRHPQADVLEVAGVGHAPMLDEPGVVEALRGFIERLPQD